MENPVQFHEHVPTETTHKQKGLGIWNPEETAVRQGTPDQPLDQVHGFYQQGPWIGSFLAGGGRQLVCWSRMCVCVRGLRASFWGRFKGRKENLHFVRPLG